MGLVLLFAPANAAAQEAERAPDDLPTVTATWRGVPARSVCRRLTELTGQPVILDRRLDPDTPITISAEATPLVELLGELAGPLGGRCAILPASIRIAPGHAAVALIAADTERTRTLASLPPALRRLAAGRAAWAWADGARPRDLLADIAHDSGIELAGLDDIPHDHLAAADLPALPLAERLDLLLSWFDRRIDWRAARTGTDRVALAIVPLPAPPGDDGAVVVRADGPRAPTVKPPRPAVPPRPPAAATTTWTLEVAAPLDQLLATVAMRLGLELSLDREGLRAKGIAAAGVVRLSVRDVDRDTLLDRIVEPLGLAWTIDGRTLRVGPKAE